MQLRVFLLALSALWLFLSSFLILNTALFVTVLKVYKSYALFHKHVYIAESGMVQYRSKERMTILWKHSAGIHWQWNR